MSNEEVGYEGIQSLLEGHFPLSEPPSRKHLLSSPRRVRYFPGIHNRLGYRADEFDDRGDFNIVFLGCSWTEGSGVARGRIFSDIVSERIQELTGLGVRSWNLGAGGSGLDYNLRLAPIVVQSMRPDLVVLVVSGEDRREYFTTQGARVTWKQKVGWLSQDQNRIPREELEIIINAFTRLQNPYNDLAHLLSGFRAIACMLDAACIPWGYSWIDRPEADDAMRYLLKQQALPMEPFVGRHFEHVDNSSVDSHPGIKSHAQFAEVVIKWILNQDINFASSIKQKSQPTISSEKSKSVLRRVEEFLNAKRNKKDKGEDIYPLW